MQKDWSKFYQENKAPQEPSSFAQFILNQELPGWRLIDLGCGNGRDAYFLSQQYGVIGIDPGMLPKDSKNVYFFQEKWQDAKHFIETADIVYSRFFLHAISNEEIAEILTLAPNYFCAEARAVGDKPVVYPEHERNYINIDWLKQTAEWLGYDILHLEQGRGLAPYKDEDPLVVRIIAKRK